MAGAGDPAAPTASVSTGIAEPSHEHSRGSGVLEFVSEQPDGIDLRDGGHRGAEQCADADGAAGVRAAGQLHFPDALNQLLVLSNADRACTG